MTSPDGPLCDYCHRPLPGGKGRVDFWFTHEIFCTEECLQARSEERRRHDNKRLFVVSKYSKSRFWGLYDGNGDLIAVTVYRKGAEELQRRLSRR